jgi:hypothetical protein
MATWTKDSFGMPRFSLSPEERLSMRLKGEQSMRERNGWNDEQFLKWANAGVSREDYSNNMEEYNARVRRKSGVDPSSPAYGVRGGMAKERFRFF